MRCALPTGKSMAVVSAYISLPLEKVLYGPGSVNELPRELERFVCPRAFILTGNTLATRTPLVQRLVQLLGECHVGTFSRMQQHVPESSIEDAVRAARECNANLLISFGGGSPIDGAKAVAHALAGDDRPPPPQIAIPTTLSAAEYSHVAGYTVESTRTKARVADYRLTPRVVILDPEMTLETPPWLWSSSGIRALDHAVETLYAPGDHAVQDLLALQAIRDLFTYLPIVRNKPEDLNARLRCQQAAWMSFFAPASITYGLSHSLSKAFGATFGVPHGITSCITLAPVMRHMVSTNAQPLARMARALGKAAPNTPDEEAALEAAGAVAALIQQLSLPSRLRDVGVPREAFARIATTAVGNTPERADVMRLLEAMW